MISGRNQPRRHGRTPIAPKPAFREVIDSNDPVLAKVHDLIRRTFPPDELVGRSEWRDSLREREAGLWSDSRWHLVVAERAGSVIGVASGTYLGNVNTGVIGYLAVSPAARGFGVGPRLREALRRLFRRDARQIRGEPLRAVVGEVHRTNPWLRTLIRSDRVLALNFRYYQPSIRRGERPVALVLYYEFIRRPKQRLPTSLIRTLLYSVWRRIYRIPRPMSHRVFRDMLKELAPKKSLGEIRVRDLPPPEKVHS